MNVGREEVLRFGITCSKTVGFKVSPPLIFCDELSGSAILHSVSVAARAPDIADTSNVPRPYQTAFLSILHAASKGIRASIRRLRCAALVHHVQDVGLAENVFDVDCADLGAVARGRRSFSNSIGAAVERLQKALRSSRAGGLDGREAAGVSSRTIEELVIGFERSEVVAKRAAIASAAGSEKPGGVPPQAEPV